MKNKDISNWIKSKGGKVYMKKKSIKLIIIVVFLVIILPYLFVECNTILFGDEFKNEYKQTNMISDIKYYKVFYKTKKYS